MNYKKYLEDSKKVTAISNEAIEKTNLSFKLIIDNFEKYMQIKEEDLWKHKYDIKFYEYFIYDDFEKMHKGFDKLFDFSMIYKVSMFEYLQLEMRHHIMIQEVMQKAEIIPSKIKLPSFETLNTVVNENFKSYLENENLEIRLFTDLPTEVKNILLDTTLKLAIDELKEQDIKIKNCNYQSVKEELKKHINIIKTDIKNNRVMAKVKDSYLSKIIRDDLEFSEKYNAPYLKNYKDGLAVGYSQRSFLLGADKKKVISELNTKIKILEDYNMENTEILISKTKELIELVKMQKHKDKIPFKTIGKKLNMTTNEAKNYAKKILSVNNISFSPTTFSKVYN